MTDEEVTELAKFAAETLNGGDFYDERFYQNKHREAWENMIRALLCRIYSKIPLFQLDDDTAFHHDYRNIQWMPPLIEGDLSDGDGGGAFIHHINGDPTDNRPENLRIVTASENRRDK